MFSKGDKVKVNGRKGEVVYVRMGGHNYNVPEAYSVFMYDQMHRMNYEGSIWPANKVEADDEA